MSFSVAPGVNPDSILNQSAAYISAGDQAASASSDGAQMSIAEIRDMVDAMANSGQLSDKEQMELISAGFQDLNAEDPTYQPADGTGYTRSTQGTLDPVAVAKNYGAFDAGMGNSSGAATWQDIANLFAARL